MHKITRKNILKQRTDHFGAIEKGSMFRIHPDLDSRADGASVLYHDYKWYVLEASVAERLSADHGFINGIYQGTLYQSTDSRGNNDIVVVSYSNANNVLLKYVEKAMDIWIERSKEQGLQFKECPNINISPQWAMPFDDLLDLRLKQCDRYINDINHPIIQMTLQKFMAME